MPADVFALLLDRLSDVYAAFLAADGRPSLDEWRCRAALLGERVTVEEAGQVQTGTFVGIDEDGALLLDGSAGEPMRFVAGDLVRGPSAAP